MLRSYFWCRVCAGRWMAAIRHVVTPYLCSTAAPKRDRARARKMKEWDAWAAASAPCPLDALLLCSRRRTSARFAIRAARGSRRRIGGLAEPLRAKQRLCLHAPREGRCFNRSRWPSMRGQPESRRSDFWRPPARNGFWLRGMGTESIPRISKPRSRTAVPAAAPWLPCRWRAADKSRGCPDWMAEGLQRRQVIVAH